MSTETVVTPDVLADEDTRSVADIEAEAEAAEAQLKAARAKQTEEDIRANQLRRLEKAKAKLADLETPAVAPQKVSNELSVDDTITLREKGFAKDSPQAKLLQTYKAAGLIQDYQSGLAHVGLKAEFDALAAAESARDVIDENGNKIDASQQSRKTVIARYKTDGVVPKDPALQDEIAKQNLKDMGMIG